MPWIHNQSDGAQQLGFALPRGVAQDCCLAARGKQQATEDLQRRGFSCSVGSQKPDNLTFLEVELDVLHRYDLGKPSRE
jgi:hypothetical protein